MPPTILSPVAERQGLAVTLMERMLRRVDGQSCVRMLTTQYRMHEDIMKWSSDQLYQSKLAAHPSVAQHLLCHLPGVEDNEDTSKSQAFFNRFIYPVIQAGLSLLQFYGNFVLLYCCCFIGQVGSAVKLHLTAMLKVALLLLMNCYDQEYHSRCCMALCKQHVP